MFKRFKELYESSIRSDLQKQFGYKNLMAIPYIKKIVINMGVGEAVSDSKIINNALNDLTLISGQKPIFTFAKKSIANFKLREGVSIGCKVTLRKSRMYDFLERLVFIALPRGREFRGFSKKGFDGRGNFNFGIKEQIIFSEIDYDKIDQIRGMDIAIVTSAKTDEEALNLLSKFNLPFN